MDIDEEKVPWKDAILRRVQGSADYNQSPTFFLCLPNYRAECRGEVGGEGRALAILESSPNLVEEGLVYPVFQ